jgi:glycine/D-amino acid oxidase-like deaminating enzyme
MSRKPHVAIVGAGIVGSAIGLELAGRGAAVTLVDAGGERASENSFGWINASWFNRPDYFRLRHFSMGAWRRWEARVSGLAPRWTGCLLWELDGEDLAAFVRDYGAMGYALRMVGRDTIREIEPALADPPEQAALAAAEGYVDGGAAASALRVAALAAGARLVEAAVPAVELGAVRLADGRRIGADRIVVAAGNGAAGLLGLPVHAVSGLMALSAPARSRIAHVLTPPELNLRQASDGRILCAGGPGGSEVNANPHEIARDLVSRARVLIGEPALELERILIGHRPTPADGHPIIGPVKGSPGVYVAVMHSGVTLAPGVAELVAAELLDGTEALLLAPFRPNRFGG